MITATLNITVTYDDDTYVDKEKAEAALLWAASFLANNGHLTDSETSLDSWNATVKIEETYVEEIPHDEVDQLDLPWNDPDAPFQSGDY